MAENGNCMLVVRHDILVQFQAIQYETNLDVDMQMEQFFQLYHCVKSVHVKLDRDDLDADSTIVLSDVFKKFASDYSSPLSTASVVPKIEDSLEPSTVPSVPTDNQDYPKVSVLNKAVSKIDPSNPIIPQSLYTEHIAPQEQSDAAAFPAEAVALTTFSVQADVSPSKNISHNLEETFFEAAPPEQSDNDCDMTSMILQTSNIQEIGSGNIADEVLLPSGCISIGSNTEENKMVKKVVKNVGRKRGPYRSKVDRGIPIEKDEILDKSELNKDNDTKSRLSSVPCSSLEANKELRESEVNNQSAAKLKYYITFNEDIPLSEHRCRFCDSMFCDFEKFSNHVKTHTGLKPYVCIKCKKTFTERSSLVAHKKLHLGESAFKYLCDICGKKFAKGFTLSRHRHIHFHERSVISSNSEANKNTPEMSNSNMASHERNSLDIKHKNNSRISPELKNTQTVMKTKRSRILKHQCRYCDGKFDTEEMLMSHVQVHSGLRPYECDQCEKSFTERSSMISHKKLHTDPKVYKYVCEICNRSFSKNSSLNRHRRTHTGAKPFKCYWCQQCLANKYTLKAHIAKRHKNEICVSVDESSSNQSRVNIFSCKFCDKLFTTKTTLVSHKVNDHGFLPFQCGQCDKSFPRQSSLRVHMSSHINYKPFKCDQCNRCFLSVSALNLHKKTHSDNTVYTCKVCGKYFHFKGGLTQHSRIHNPTRSSFTCNVCSKLYTSRTGFVKHFLQVHQTESVKKKKQLKCPWCPFVCDTQNYMNKHSVVHTGQKDHMCECCGMKFSFEYSLKRHMLTRHSKTCGFQCSVCDKRYHLAYDLHRHMKTHTDKKQHKCDNCEKIFRTETCLIKHTRKVHENNKSILNTSTV